MIGKLNAGNLQKTTIFNIMEKQEQIPMYEGVIKESNTLLKLYNSMLTYLNPDKEELKKHKSNGKTNTKPRKIDKCSFRFCEFN